MPPRNVLFPLAATALVALAATQGARTGPRWEPDAKWTSEARSYVTPPKAYVTKRETAIAIGRAAILDRYAAELLGRLEALEASDSATPGWCTATSTPNR